MKTETEWKERALEVAMGYGHCKDESTLHKAILTFAKDYAAEALAELERLRDGIENFRLGLMDAARINADLRAQLAKCNNALAATMAVENDLRAQLAAAGPVKVPDHEVCVSRELLSRAQAHVPYMGETYRKITEVLRLNTAASPANTHQLLHDFADYLHKLPDENGWEVGPMQVKFTNGAVSSGPLWVGQDDTRRWADQFLAQLAAPPKENG